MPVLACGLSLLAKPFSSWKETQPNLLLFFFYGWYNGLIGADKSLRLSIVPEIIGITNTLVQMSGFDYNCQRCSFCSKWMEYLTINQSSKLSSVDRCVDWGQLDKSNFTSTCLKARKDLLSKSEQAPASKPVYELTNPEVFKEVVSKAGFSGPSLRCNTFLNPNSSSMPIFPHCSGVWRPAGKHFWLLFLIKLHSMLLTFTPCHGTLGCVSFDNVHQDNLPVLRTKPCVTVFSFWGCSIVMR